MTKVYLLNENKNNATIIIFGRGGNMVKYTFKDGNESAKIKASCVLNNEYYQQLLEGSKYFEKRIVILDPTFKQADTVQAATVQALTKVTDVKTVTQAIEWCADTLGEVVKTAKQAKALAEKNGYDLVNLKVKE